MTAHIAIELDPYASVLDQETQTDGSDAFLEAVTNALAPFGRITRIITSALTARAVEPTGSWALGTADALAAADPAEARRLSALTSATAIVAEAVRKGHMTAEQDPGKFTLDVARAFDEFLAGKSDV